jgi:CRP-like cAMP-binding protein
LRSGLFDIDVLINRTLVYGTLSALLGGMYFGSVVLLQQIARSFNGQRQDSTLVIILSTLLIAALFQPLRRRIQRTIDQRFYRAKYDAAKTVERFAATLRQQVELDQLNAHLVEAVQETMRPEHVSLWLRSPHSDTRT